MRSRLPLLVVTVALAVLLAACGGVPADVAATVGGERIPMETVARIVAQQPEGVAAAPSGEGQRTVLSLIVRSRIIEDAARRRGVEVTEEDIDAVAEQQAGAVGGAEQLRQQLRQLGLDDEQARQLVFRMLALESALREEVAAGPATEAELRERYREQRDQLGEAGLRHILLDSESAAADVKRQLEQGADFAELARQRSTDTRSAQQGGRLGTVSLSQVPDSVAAALEGATAGDVVGPVRTQAGWHVLGVDSIERSPPFASVRDRLAQQLQQERQQAYQQFLTDLFAEAEVRINRRLGRWDPASGRVEPPEPVVGSTGSPGRAELPVPGATAPASPAPADTPTDPAPS